MTPTRRHLISAAAGGAALCAAPLRAATPTDQADITIRAGDGLVTLINVFTVEPKNQDALLALLVEGTETLFSKLPGYVSASFHKSPDGRRIVNYGQWKSAKDIEAFRTRPEIGAYFARIKALSQFEAIACEASYVHHI